MVIASVRREPAILAPYRLMAHKPPLPGSRYPKSAQAVHVSVTGNAGAQTFTLRA